MRHLHLHVDITAIREVFDLDHGSEAMNVTRKERSSRPREELQGKVTQKNSSSHFITKFSGMGTTSLHKSIAVE